ncbi:MAG: nickel-dependent lactate racemase [Geobacter sp.]|nr:nickel-dependent lactate racemase [Geobacter sp.]
MELFYGNGVCTLNIPSTNLQGVIRPALDLPAESGEALICRALDGCDAIIREFRPGERVVVVTSDITRYTGSEIYLPLLVERLTAAGIRQQDIEILIALGIHRKQTEHEHKKILGPLFGQVRVTDHDCDDPGELAFIGRTGNGIDIELNRRVVEADRVILTSTIGFHYFAGFGGGRKSVLPGVASRRACMASHFAVLNPSEGSGKNPLATTGNLDGNPVHQAMEEACALVEPDFILNTVLSPDKRIMAAFAGHWRDAHLAGCRYYAERFTCPLREKADLVVVSCGGSPKDINLIQAHKSMEYASHALKDGGVMVLLAECRDGYGNATFSDWFKHRDLAEFEAALRRHYEINGQTAYSTLQKAQRFRILLVSSLPPEEVETMSMIPAKGLDEAMGKAAEMLPEDYKAYVIPEGGTVLPILV